MIKIAVCDDEKKDRETICSLLEEYRKEQPGRFETVPFESGEQLLNSDLKPDIIFLDIVMKDKDGFQTGAEIKRKYPEVIIVYNRS